VDFLRTIGIAIAGKLLPVVLVALENHGKILVIQVMDAISKELEDRIPAMTAALVTAVTEAVAQVAVQGVDKITDVIPGQLDDEILDPIVARAVEIFRQFGLGR
jgi:hypothetical protein